MVDNKLPFKKNSFKILRDQDIQTSEIIAAFKSTLIIIVMEFYLDVPKKPSMKDCVVGVLFYTAWYEPPRGKTNNVVSEQVRHKPACTATEKS